MLDSPLLMKRVVKRIAPQYHFRYEKLNGTPLRGIVLEGLRYKNRLLARQIDLRIDPLGLLRGRVLISQLHLLGVHLDTLERLVADFTPENPDSRPETELSLPVAIEVRDIDLSLRPFFRSGVRVEKARVSIDSILYDTRRFNVGNLSLQAVTSLGEVEFAGTYRRRYLNVDILALEDLDLEGIERLLRSESAEKPAQSSSPSGDVPTPGAQKEASQRPSPFLPRQIHASKLWITVKEYAYKDLARMEWGQLEGKELLIDFNSSKVLRGEVTAELQSDLADARVQLELSDQRYLLRRGLVEELDLPRLERWLRSFSSDDGNETAEKNASAPIPFLAPRLEIADLRASLKEDQNLSGLGVEAAVVNLRGAGYDLNDSTAEIEKLSGYARTSVGSLVFDGSLTPEEIRLEHLKVDRLDLEALKGLEEGKSADKASDTSASKSSAKEPVAGQNGPLPDRLFVVRAKLSLAPLVSKEFKLSSFDAQVEELEFLWPGAVARSGRVSVNLRSDLARAELRGEIRENALILNPDGGSEILLQQELFRRWKIPVRSEALTPLRLSGRADREKVDVRIDFSGRDLLEGREESRLRLDVNRSETTAHYRFSDGNFSVTHHSVLSTPQVPELHLDLHLKGEGNQTLNYRGELKALSLNMEDSRFQKLLGKPHLKFHGDLHGLTGDLQAGVLEGEIDSPDLRKARLLLKTPKAIRLGEYISLPKELAAARASFEAISDLNLTAPLPLNARINLSSNVLNLRGSLRYDGNTTGTFDLKWPQKSLLTRWDPKLRLREIGPMRLKLSQHSARWDAVLHSRLLRLDAGYDSVKRSVSLKAKIAGATVTGEGSWPGQVTLKSTTPSIRRLLEGLNRIYKIEPIPPFNGDMTLTATLKDQRVLEAAVSSKSLIPDDTARIKSPIKDLQIRLRGDLRRRELRIERYGLTVDGMPIYSRKSSLIRLDGETIWVEPLWVNDSLTIRGRYNRQKKKGSFQIKGEKFTLDHPLAKVDAKVDLKTTIDGERVDTKGTILLLGGVVRYNVEAKRYATDEDIIILQHRKKKEESFFRKNVSLSIMIKSKKPLQMKQKTLQVELSPHLSLLKGYNDDLQLIGSIELQKGGYYLFEGKKFVLEPSRINFTGNPSQPLLDIRLRYRRYSRTVYIAVTGRATEPTLNFSSDPYMTRDQILSLILFDTVDAGDEAGDMLSLVGGGIAKSILGNIGLKVDTLVLTQEGFEVGKKISDKITIVYDQKKEPRVIVRIQHSRHTETDISIGSESQSVDIIYKKEF